MKFIKLDEKSYFKVISKETDRIVTVVGMYLSGDKVMRYEIKEEGDWSVSRFKKMESSILCIERQSRYFGECPS